MFYHVKIACYHKLSRKISLSSLPLMVARIQEDVLSFSNCVDISRGWVLERFEELFKMILVIMVLIYTR